MHENYNSLMGGAYARMSSLRPRDTVASRDADRVSRLLKFSKEQILVSSFNGLAIGAQGDRDTDSSGGETDVQPDPTERGEMIVARARTLHQRDLVEADIYELRSLQQEILALLGRRGGELDSSLEEQLRRWLRRLADAERQLDTGATQGGDSQAPVVVPEESEMNAAEDGDDEDPGGGFDDNDDVPLPPSGSGGSQLVSQLADDLEELDGLDDEDPPPAQGPSEATELQDMAMDEGDRKTRALRDLRDLVVAVLRDVPVDGIVPQGLRDRALTLRRKIQFFQSASEAARRLLAALATLLALPTTGETTDPVRPGAPTPADAPPLQPRIVGRATDVLLNGSRRQTFLLFVPQSQPPYQWLTEMGMLADQELASILDAYAGNKADDPTGNGFVTAIVDARGPNGRRQYKVQWTVDPQVPLRFAQPEWLLRRQLVDGAQALADAYERRDEEDGDEESDDDDAMAEGPDSEPSQQGPDAGRRKSALQWDPGAGRPKLSLRRAVATYASGQTWTVRALIEYTLTRIFALRSRTPPAPGQSGAPSPSELDQLGKDLFTIDEKALVAVFKQERVQAQRDARLEAAGAGEEDDGEEEEADEDTLLATWRVEREEELRDEALARWAQTRRADAQDLATLRAQLEALKAVEAAGGNPSDVNVDELGEEGAAALLATWVAAGDVWPAQLARPRLKLPRIRDFLNPNRSAKARGWLKLQRDIHSAATAQERRSGVYGSAYGPTWPSRPSATSCPADHVSPVRWFEGGTKLIIECGDPAQTPAVVLSTLEQNSGKTDDALALFSAAGDAARAGQGVYTPKNVSAAKTAMLAKTVAWIWLLYPLISDKKRSVGVGAYARSTGCAWYGRAWESGPFPQLVKAVSTPFERRIQLLSLAMPRWQCGNPLVFDSTLADDDAKELLLDRFKGQDALPRLVDLVLQAGVVAAPR